MRQAMTTDAAAPAPAPAPARVAVPANRAAATARTRANILAAASRLFVERGFGAVSMRDIATEAGLSHPGVIRHFATKDELLEAIVADFTAITEGELDSMFGPEGDGLRTFGEVARRNAAIDGYLPLFTTLAGEATSTEHPAHTHFRERHAELRTRSSALFRAAIDDGELPIDTDVVGEPIRLAAAWDGLQLISLYLPDLVDIPAMLDRHLDRLRGADAAGGPGDATGADSTGVAAASVDAPHAPAIGAFGLAPEPEPDSGYAPGRARRAQIVADASALFARRGFHATSLREIAEQAGIGKSTLLHHFSSKDDLLGAVVAHRDSTIDERVTLDGDASPDAFLRDIPRHARFNAEHEPGLIEVYAVLSAEAAAVSHPAHAYFRRRFESAIAQFGDLFARAAQAEGRRIDAAFEAVWFVALWDGLQLQWLYDPATIDVGDHLEAHLARFTRFSPVE
ncbi:TetR/AcrR family transcriptional regulator [Agromyces sp. Leaf222]|uniref:TetR/AcrR family transcriptional regulator n=1 Tax=Agromyces sp. Leaf222 TaxID=1735688 RepID=UPI0006F4CC0A|nr:TetR family transcriptional regulator [Agromyces sp. Leaf222]KQM82064.1 hypothetical protein ASE68_01060 [Agromyces sp. Leaf222]